jgi:hypothetical protein
MIPSIAALAAYLTGASRDSVAAELADELNDTRLQVQQMDLQPDILSRALRAVTALLAVDAVAACVLLEALVDLSRRPTLPRG